jgi:hypothetical protein
MHASWMAGLAVLISGGVAGGFSPLGLVFLVVLFLPVVIAYRRDRLSFPIIFATLFLPAWPWAMYAACTNRRPPSPGSPGPASPTTPAPTSPL